MPALLRRPVTLCVVLLIAACGDDDGSSDSFSPSVENVSGNYTATSFTITTSAGTLDLLALGSSVEVTLAPNGTTTGRLFVPGGDEDGGDLDEDLTGTWILSGSIVTFSQTADTFIQDAPFTASRDQLTGEGTFGGETVRVVLTKTG
jgi:hypothetical protein